MSELIDFVLSELKPNEVEAWALAFLLANYQHSSVAVDFTEAH